MSVRALAVAALVLAGPLFAESEAGAERCGAGGLQLQVLGAGGPELAAGRAGAGYLLWVDGKARLAVDFGPGAALRFRESGARAIDLDLVLLTRVHADQTLDLPALVAAGLREGRRRPLPLYGPPGGGRIPSTVTFVRTLLDGTRGAYRHLGIVVSPLAEQGFRLDAHDARVRTTRVGVRREQPQVWEVHRNARLRVSAARARSDPMPELAWKVQIDGRSVVFATVTSGDNSRLVPLTRGADVLAAEYRAQPGSRPETAPFAALARFAAEAGAKHLIVPKRLRIPGDADPAAADYDGPVAYADDLACFPVP